MHQTPASRRPGLPAATLGRWFRCLPGHIPRQHHDNSQDFIRRALGKVEKKHDDGLLQLVERIAEFDLTRAGGVTRFGHILSALPPLVYAGFCLGRDAAVIQAFAQVQRFAPDPDSSTHHFPTSMGGAGLDSLTR